MRRFGTCTTVVLGVVLAASAMLGAQEKETSEADLLKVLPPERQAPAFSAEHQKGGFALWWGDHAAPFYEKTPPSEGDLERKAGCVTPAGEHEPMVLGVWGLRDLGTCGLWIKETPFPLTIMTAHYDDRVVPPPPVAGGRRIGIPEWLPRQATARIEAGRNTVFWIDVDVPEDAEPGKHEGLLWLVVHEREIVDKDPGGQIFKIPFTVEVLPVKIPRADIAYGMYFRPFARYLKRPEYRTPAMMDAYYRDMIAHDHTSATIYVYGGSFHDAQGNVVLDGKPDAGVIDRMKELGLIHPDVPIMLLGGIGLKGEAAKAYAPKLAAAARERGWPELLSYAPDEPSYEGERGETCIKGFNELQALRPALRLVTAINEKSARYFAKQLDVWVVHNGGISPDLAKLCDETGAEMWSYDCQHRGTNPTFNRFYAGLYTWALRLKGNFLWCYTENYSWEGDRFAVFNYVLPNGGGPVMSVGWEARREGIEDYRTLRALEKRVAEKAGDPAAAEAEAWLDDLRSRVDWETRGKSPAERYGWDAADLYSQCPNFAPTEFNEIRAKARDFLMKL